MLLLCLSLPSLSPFSTLFSFCWEASFYLFILGCSKEYCVHCDWWLIFLKFYCWKFRDNWEDGNPGSWGTSPQYQVRNLAYSVWQVGNIFVFCSFTFVVTVLYFFFPFLQPGSPPSRTYEAPTPGSGWASTPGGNYSEAGTPRDSSSAYGTDLHYLNTQTHEHIFLTFDVL